MSNLEYYALVGLIRQQQNKAEMYRAVLLQSALSNTILMGCIAAIVILVVRILNMDNSILILAVAGSLGGAVHSFIVVRISNTARKSESKKIFMTRLAILNENRSQSVEKIEKMPEFEDLFQ
jgi:hypothetical protein